MCGIIGVFSVDSVNQQIYDNLLLLQHRGQDSAGIVTMDNYTFHVHKQRGRVREAFRTRDMRKLLGNVGIGHVRYATSGAAAAEDEVQPFYVNAPYGITFVHNGNLTNTSQLEQDLFKIDRRHTNSSSDTEMLVNVLATEIQSHLTGPDLSPDQLFDAVSSLHRRVKGSYAAIALISGRGLLAFRDPFGIRPLILGRRSAKNGRDEWIVASESLVIENSGYEIIRDVNPGEAVFIDADSNLHQRQCADAPRLIPCAFEYVYLARPDSVMNGISVYESRLRMGDRLAETIAAALPAGGELPCNALMPLSQLRDYLNLNLALHWSPSLSDLSD